MRRKTGQVNNGRQPIRERLLVRAILAGAERLKQQRLKIADFIRLSELRNLVMSSVPRVVIAYWVAA